VYYHIHDNVLREIQTSHHNYSLGEEEMAQFSIEIADDDINRVLLAVAFNYKRPDSIDNPDFDAELPVDPESNPETIPNPETHYQFANRTVRGFLSENVKAYEVKEAKRLAEEQVAQNVDPVINDPAL
jgi:hypothetical protein